MNSKTFLITSILVVAVVSLITGLITISLIQKPLLAPWLGEKEGKVEVGGEFGPFVNVIIIDEGIVLNMLDIVNFPAVERDIQYKTSTTEPAIGPRPFVIRNEGNVRANVDIVSRGTQLFDSSGSYVRVWAEQAFPIVGAVPYDAIDNCRPVPIGNGPCFETTYCTELAPCDLPFDATGTSSGRNLLDGLQYLNQKDEAFIGVMILAARDEGAGTKQTTVLITGTAT